MLTDLNLNMVYDSSEDSLIDDLFIPLLSNSIKYYRGVGYFTSGWIRLASYGLAELAENGGAVKLITSPHLEEEDWKYFVKGTKAKEDILLYKILSNDINNLKISLSENTLTALAWMIADNILKIKFAIPKNKQGDFHDKFAIFIDEKDNKVVIHGSYNDSIKGNLNGESFSVFKSWIDGQSSYVKHHIKRFKDLNNNQNEFFEIYNMPEAIKDEIIKIKENSTRPYKLPRDFYLINKRGKSIPEGIKLYPFQKKALDNWFDNNCKGILKMATGTGKTITSLACATELINRVDNLIVIISVPFIHLIDQWKQDMIDFGFNPILCRGSFRKWQSQLKSKIRDFSLGYRKDLCIISTHNTSATKRFRKLFTKVDKDILFIGDEVHYLGSSKFRNSLNNKYKYRLGLSATPDRWYDEEGTSYLNQYFDKTVLEYSLEKAIENNFLTPYRFVPHIVELKDEELEQYNKLTKKIIKMKNSIEDGNDEILTTMLVKRSEIIANAWNKKGKLISLLKSKILMDGKDSIKHTIIYCGKGEHKAILRIVADLALRAHEFVHTVSTKNRQQVLNHFDNGDIQILVAIKCLDEGVNIPATKTAFFLASTTNPREFIQRRGRILRKNPGKKMAVLHDFLVLPKKNNISFLPDDYLESYRSIIKKEMPRFAEFSLGALNTFEAREIIYPILKDYNLLHLFNKKPWDVYKEQLEGGHI